MQNDLLTTEERERERQAFDLVLMGVTGALDVVPDGSAFRSALVDFRTILRCQLARAS